MIYRTLKRWGWLILLIPAFTVGAAGVHAVTSMPQYESEVVVQLTEHSPEEIAKFRQVLEASYVRRRTVEQLGLEDNAAAYGVRARPSGVAQVIASFRALTPLLAVEIGNAHMAQAIDHYLELHLDPLRAQRQSLESELSQAQEALQTAEDALASFRTEQDIGAVDERVVRLERDIATLEADRDELVAKSFADPAQSLARTEEQIAQRRAEIERLSLLAPEYNVLVGQVGSARRAFEEAATAATEEGLRTASEALAEFQIQHGVSDPDKAVLSELKLLENLEERRDGLLVEGAAQATDRVSQVDQQLSELYAELDRLNALLPTRNALKQEVTNAGQTVGQVRQRQVAAQLEEQEDALNYAVRVIQAAEMPERSISNLARTLGLALMAGLLLGLLLAFTLQYLSSDWERPLPDPPRSEAGVQDAAPGHRRRHTSVSDGSYGVQD